MKERPILFSGEMVRAILEGRKTVTRRVVKDGPSFDAVGRWGYTVHSTDRKSKDTWNYSVTDRGGHKYTERGRESVAWQGKCPYGQPRDRMWVRESFALSVCDPDVTELNTLEPRHWDEPIYKADGHPGNEWMDPENNPIPIPWRPSIHMPRWASRITLEVTGVRVERVQDITEDGAKAEGITGPHDVGYAAYHCPGDSKARYSRASAAFEDLWDSINAKRGFGWDKNPWVWVVEFKRIDA
jgi:hypothetical protein